VPPQGFANKKTKLGDIIFNSFIRHGVIVNHSTRLLCICDPTVYPPRIAEAPELYHHLSADARYELWHADTSWVNDPADAMRCVRVEDAIEYKQFQSLSLQLPRRCDLRDFDLVFCRTMKPFPDDYMQRLCQLESHVRFVNSPSSIVRHLNPCFLPEIAGGLIPETIITDDSDEAANFLRKHRRIVAKRTGSCGGQGVSQVRIDGDAVVTDDLHHGEQRFDSAESAIDSILTSDDEPFQFVRFLKNIHRGDKRVLVVSGEIVGAYLRQSTSGGWIHNICSGGKSLPTEVGQRERELIAKTAPIYSKMDIRTLGYDFLVDDDGRWIISEINAGNVAGYTIFEDMTGEKIYPHVLDLLLEESQEID
jgi:glutathione synthase/RimK-type ligase-like ATP-grasp enzyme